MKCAVHSEVEATGYCRNCGKALCPECTRDVRGALYCESCLAGLVAAAPAQPGGQAPAKSDTHPWLAATLGFIPGLGAVYNGEYLKALIHVLIFGGLIAAHSNDAGGEYMVIVHIAIACFYFYMPIDAYRVAKARSMGQPLASVSDPVIEGTTRSGKPIGAYVLIFLGVMFLMANFGLLREDWIAKAWPLALIAVGGWLLWERMSRKAS